MNGDGLSIVIVGLSITSSWGNGHATTYRALVRALADHGHDVLFLERDMPWYAANRDCPSPSGCRTVLYHSVEQLMHDHLFDIREADVVIVGSYVPEGARVGEWVVRQAQGVTAFYDIDTPVTLAALARGDCSYVSPELIGAFDLYLSFTGGPTLSMIERRYGSPCARPLYCSVDPVSYYPQPQEPLYDCGYMGTYSEDRQPGLERLLLDVAWQLPARSFVVAGPQYPSSIRWPPNVLHFEHLEPSRHRGFYNLQRFTLNLTRADMVRAGYSPSVRLFEAAACGVPIISDYWEGLETFFAPGDEILIARSTDDTIDYLREIDESERSRIAGAARQRILASHTNDIRATELEEYVKECAGATVLPSRKLLDHTAGPEQYFGD
ncbi:MAG: glycosyltransferase [Chitinivibrionales bacterium]|nr:glycosyltransferase [Chitinivibrionales bacterium]